LLHFAAQWSDQTFFGHDLNPFFNLRRIIHLILHRDNCLLNPIASIKHGTNGIQENSPYSKICCAPHLEFSLQLAAYPRGFFVKVTTRNQLS
jgi:hypothetical protein